MFLGAPAAGRSRSDQPIRQPSPTGDTVHDTSVTSAWSDEGLELSQQLTESIFAGPDLDSDGEELVSGNYVKRSSKISRNSCK